MELKKSAVDLTELAIGILILGIVVSIGATILLKMRDARLTDSTVVTTNSEPLSFTGNTATLTNHWGKAVVNVTNSTGSLLNSGNYTSSISDLDGTITITNLSASPGNATYTWYNTTTRPDFTLANQSAIGLGEYGNWFKIIVIVGVAALVLGIIFISFGKGSTGTSQSESGGSY